MRLVIRRTSLGIAVVALVVGALGGCGPFAKSSITPSKCTSDPCASMVCPDGMRCSVTGACSPRCEPMTYKTF